MEGLSRLTVLTVLIPLIFGLILPGPCPIKRTEIVGWSLDYNGRMVGFLPFANKSVKTFFFGETTAKNLNCNRLHLQYINGLFLTITNLLSPSTSTKGHLELMSNDSASWLSVVRNGVQMDTNPFREKVYFWIYNEIALFWSCIEIANSSTHDEALIFTISEDRYQNLSYGWLPSEIEFFNQNFNESILSKIIFAQLPEFSSQDQESGGKRPSVSLNNNIKSLMVVFIGTTVGLCSVVIGCLYFQKNNQVGVIDC